MKKLLLFLAVCLGGLNVFSQKVVENPRYLASTISALKITRIELQDTCTILDFCYTNVAGGSFNIPKGSYIQPSDGGGKLLVTRAEGADLESSVPIPEIGKATYRLFFPRLDISVPMIDFGEGEDGSWYIFNIELVPQVRHSVFPGVIEGNWFRTDGSREWVYGFQYPVVLYNSEIYQPVTVTKKGKGYELSLTKDGEALTIYARPAKNDGLLIGTDPKKLELFSREPVIKTDYVIPGDEEYSAPVIKSGVAVYKGYLKGYLPKMGKTGTAFVNDIFSQEQKEITVDLGESGDFEVQIPMDYPHGIFVRIPGINSTVFLEPGKSVFNFIDLTDGAQKAGASLFMGELARINTDLLVAEPVGLLNSTEVEANIGKMSLPEYKTWMLTMGKQMEDSLSRFIAGYPMCRKALQVKKINLTASVCEDILSYNMYKRYYYKEDAKQPTATDEKPDTTFYYFLPADDVNNHLSLLSTNYNTLINRLVYSDEVRQVKISLYQPLLDSAHQLGWKLSDLEEQMLTELASGKPMKGEGAVSKEILDTWTQFSAKHVDLVSAVSLAVYHEQTTIQMNKYFRIEPGLVTDLVLSQRLFGLMNSSWSPMNDYQTKLVSKVILTPEIRQILVRGSKNMEEKLAALEVENRNKKGYWYHESPEVPVDSLFGAIMAEHKGKLLFVDFWATWCSPCKEGIKRMKPLKEEYIGRNVDFIYITGPSSPQKTYDFMIPDIKGQHYRVSKEGWNYLCKQFNITGIPHYMLVDQLGNIVGDDVDSMGHSNELLRNLFDRYLKK